MVKQLSLDQVKFPKPKKENRIFTKSIVMVKNETSSDASATINVIQSIAIVFLGLFTGCVMSICICMALPGRLRNRIRGEDPDAPLELGRRYRNRNREREDYEAELRRLN